MTPAILALEIVSQPYRLLHYSHTGSGLGYGEEAVGELGLDPKKVFKTLFAAVAFYHCSANRFSKNQLAILLREKWVRARDINVLSQN